MRTRMVRNGEERVRNGDARELLLQMSSGGTDSSVTGRGHNKS